MYLKDAERGKGIGSEIFDEIKQFADKNNLEISLYNDGDFNTTFWENKNFQEWSSKNNVDFANTPDDKLGLFILDTDTPTNVASSYHYNVEMVDGYPINQNPENFWTNPEDAIFGQQYKIDEFIDELIKLNTPIKNHPVMQQLLKMMPNIETQMQEQLL